MSTPRSFSRLVSASVVGSWSSFAMVYLYLSLCGPRCNVWHLSRLNFNYHFWDESCSAARSLCRRLDLSVVGKHQYAGISFTDITNNSDRKLAHD